MHSRNPLRNAALVLANTMASSLSSDAETEVGIAAQEKTPGRHQSKGKATLLKPHCPCRVCGMTFPDMPKGSKECWDHKRDGDALIAHLTSQVKEKKDQESKEELKQVKKLKETATEAPSDWSARVLDYAQKCPSLGQGKSRGAYSGYRQLEETVAESSVHSGVWCIKMHKEMWLKYATGTLVIPETEALRNWNEWLGTFDHDDPKQVDKNGPEFSKLQLNCPTEVYTDGFEGQSHMKRTQLMGKLKKTTNMQEVEDAQRSVNEGHAQFSDTMFASAGGGLMHKLKTLGCAPKQEFAGGSSTSSPGKFGADIELQPEKPKKTKNSTWRLTKRRFRKKSQSSEL